MKTPQIMKKLGIILLFFGLVSCQFGVRYPSRMSKDFQEQYIQSSERLAIYEHFVNIGGLKQGEQNIKTFDNAFSLIYYNYVSDVDLKLLLSEAHKAVIKEKNPDTSLDKGLKAVSNRLDSHSDWLNKNELKALNDMINGEYVGIGTVISKHALGAELQRVYEGGPAQKAGLREGDIITHAGSENLKGKDLSEIAEKLKGKKGSIAAVKILRNNQVKSFDIRRDTVEINPVWADIKNKNVIYLRLDSFSSNASDDLRKKLSEMQKKGGKSLILDLRANPGGLFPEAVDVSDIFLPKKKEIVSAQKREKFVTDRWSSRKGDASGNMKMVVLIDEHSASASEIVAAALKDNNRAVIIGHRSFGKGSIQEVIPVSAKGALRLTFALYQSPDGKLIQAAGVTPHIRIDLPEKQGERLEDQKGAMIPKNRHIDKAEYNVPGESCKKYEQEDLILNCALEFLETNKLGDFQASFD